MSASDYVCCHCDGAGTIDIVDLDMDYGYVQTVADCMTCETTGVASVDDDGRCSCDDCLALPAEQRYCLEVST